ncbi:MAG: response regulator [Planctomycetaceae bacterium]
MSFRSVLVVDANPESAERVQRTLGTLGYHVELAETGAVAIQLCRQVTFDVGIISEVLPDVDGTLLFEKLSALQAGLRGVLVAAVGNLSTVYAAISAGMQRVVTRPIDFSELLPVMERPASNGAPRTISLARGTNMFTEYEIVELSSEQIRYQLSTEELMAIIRSVEYPFAGKDRLSAFDRDTLERVVHLVRRWCRGRVGAAFV